MSNMSNNSASIDSNSKEFEPVKKKKKIKSKKYNQNRSRSRRRSRRKGSDALSKALDTRRTSEFK